MLICRNAEGVHGKKKVGNLCSNTTAKAKQQCPLYLYEIMHVAFYGQRKALVLGHDATQSLVDVIDVGHGLLVDDFTRTFVERAPDTPSLAPFDKWVVDEGLQNTAENGFATIFDSKQQLSPR